MSDSKSFKETLTSTIIAPADYDEVDSAETGEKRPAAERLGLILIAVDVVVVLALLGIVAWRVFGA
jgi:hypothetical protein